RNSEAVFTSLPGPREVESTVLDPATGILAGLSAGGAFIDMTTNAPSVARRIAEACHARGVEMLDAPVSGRPPTMTVMVGGPAPAFAKFRPLLEAMAGNIFHVGEAGAGCTAKLVTQYLGYTNFVAALEGMLIGAKAGIDLGVLARIVPLSAGASRTFDNVPRSVLSGTFTAGGT
ncbi:MAG: NAD(P)-dependent oxidoreductase, partial [Alphaproteobacteria bacterium]